MIPIPIRGREEKLRARRLSASKRDRLPSACLRKASLQIIPHVLQYLGPAKGIVGVYASFRSELPSRPLIDALLGSGYRVAVPRIHDDAMHFVEIRSADDLEPGTFGIDTARGTPCDAELEILLIPALAFTPSGLRLGYGGGYYDRYLGQHPNLGAVGLAMDVQLVDDLPHEAHDRIMDAVISEAGIRRGDTDRSVDVVAAAIVQEDQVLVARRRPGTSHSGWWEFPGGKVEQDEAPAHAIQREIHEELGWDVEALTSLQRCEHTYPNLRVNLELWLCRPNPREHDVRLTPPRSTDHDRLMWARVEDLETLPFAAADVGLLDSIRMLLTSAS